MFKKLTGKNQKDYENAARYVMDNADEHTFSELVEKDDFLFDFVKQNVSKRLLNATNNKNWKNILKFLKYYSPSYEEFICSVLAKYADEDITDTMLDLFANGNENEKTYCAKFFSYIQDSLAIPLLKQNSYTQNEYLNTNCALTLSIMQEKSSYKEAIEKLNSLDDFEKLSAIKFLINYGDENCLTEIIESMKNSTLAENIAGEIPYLKSIIEILNNNFEDGLLIINNIINGLGEILALSQIFDYELYDVIKYLLTKTDDSRVAVVLLNTLEKFEILTENDEYLFEEDKNTKNEVYDIKNLLCNYDKNNFKSKAEKELNENSLFIYTALDYATNPIQVKELLKSNNQTVILKSIEILKKLNCLDNSAKTIALKNITDQNIKNIINAL